MGQAQNEYKEREGGARDMVEADRDRETEIEKEKKKKSSLTTQVSR